MHEDDYIVVWEFDCPYMGSFSSGRKGGLRYCKKDKKWKRYEECYKCNERRDKGV